MPDPDNTTKRTVDEITHQLDPTCVTTPSPDALPSRAPRDTPEVFALVVRKGPLSFDQLMRTHLSELSRTDAFVALEVLQEMEYVDRTTVLTEHGIAQNMWYVPSHHEHGLATKRTLVAEVLPESPLSYDVNGALETLKTGDRYRGAWWLRVLKDGLKALSDVETAARDSNWREGQA